MVSETLAEGLQQYRIGQKVRALRKLKKLGLVQLSEHTGLSPGMLSKLERGQLFPTLPTLMRIALVFGVGLEHFFIESQQRRALAVIRREDRLRLPDRPGDTEPSFFFESLDFPVTDRKMEAFLAEFPVQSKPTEPHTHEGAEFVYVLQGQLSIEVEDTVFTLRKGDAMYFDSAAPHSYRHESTSDCSVIVVVAR
jgi:transcriptional regulator with XRE-family HTH domain